MTEGVVMYVWFVWGGGSIAVRESLPDQNVKIEH